MKQIEAPKASLAQIFWTFFRIGAFTFGGGYAMIPLIEAEVTTKQKWFKKQEIIDIIAISQCSPGAIAINSATYIGHRLGGRAGSAAAALGVVLPSFLVILVIAALFGSIQDNPFVQGAFKGLRPAVVALILSAVFRFARHSLVNRKAILIAVVALAVSIFFPAVHPSILLLAGGLWGYWTFFGAGRERKGE